ncbi:AAA family ATPase [Streptacidiphilus sp. N1-12]|uniref:AAA family ATPase n=2 Tax=Streptacidiphilus alkalitolerans TaxID=3342712 RepID=A0ABV6WQN3_9ACTN
MAVERPRLVLVCGLPGAGKTTLARRLAQELSAVRLCPDEWMVDLGFDRFDGDARDRVEARLWIHAQELLTRGAVVIMENGFWDRAERDEMRLLARSLGAAVELRYLDVPSSELHRRVGLRNKEPGAAVISPELLAECEAAIEVPGAAELELFDAPFAEGPAVTPR